MKVYKFGGASVRTADGVRNLAHIVEGEENLFIIVSAMGKTTNALERVFAAMQKVQKEEAYAEISEIEAYHAAIINDLWGEPTKLEEVDALFTELRDLIDNTVYRTHDAELWYDTIVAFGELISTTIISNYLNVNGVANCWVDMRRAILTEQLHKNASVNIEASEMLLKREIADSPVSVFVGQGFIGSAPDGTITTLGREGSDYSAAIVANVLDADSMVVWKDVDGILNADPKKFPEAKKIERLNYMDTIEMSYSGAQIIHPKTIKHLKQKNIPLYVRSFSNKHATGSVITGDVERTYETFMTHKDNVVLLKLHLIDLSYMLEEMFARLFAIFDNHRIHINLVHNTAVDIYIAVDSSWHIDDVVSELMATGLDVDKQENVEIITIRHYDDEIYRQYDLDENIIIKQVSPQSIRIVRKK